MDRTAILELLRDSDVRQAFRAVLAPETPSFMTAAHFAERHEVSLATVQRWMTAGLPYYKADTVRRIPVIEGDAWLLRGEANKTPQRKKRAS